MRLIRKFIQYRRIVIRLHEIQTTTLNIFELRTSINILNRVDTLWEANQLKE